MVRAKPKSDKRRDDESDKADDAGKSHSGGGGQGGGSQKNPFGAGDIKTELLGLVIAELQEVEGVPAEEQDAKANEEIRRDGQDGGPTRLACTAEQPAQRAPHFTGR